MLKRWETFQTTPLCLFSLTGLAVSESHQKLAKPVPRRSGGKTQMKRILDLLQRRPGSEEFNLAEKLRARASRTLKVYEASFSVLMLDTDLYSAGFAQKRLVKGMSEEEKNKCIAVKRHK